MEFLKNLLTQKRQERRNSKTVNSLFKQKTNNKIIYPNPNKTGIILNINALNTPVKYHIVKNG